MIRTILTVLAVLYSSILNAEIKIGTTPPVITLSGKEGGKVTGGNWSSSEIRGKVFTLFYVDPDESELNNHVSDALKKEKFPENVFGSIAVINMAATWKPNFAIESVLKGKQEKFTRTIYVKDIQKKLVKKWGLKDDSYHILIFDKKGKLAYSKYGKLSESDLKEFIKKIKTLL